jgi:tricorn protease
MRDTVRARLLPLAAALLAGAAIAPGAAPAQSAASAPLLLQHPSLSADRIAFDYGGEIWTVGRDGGRAERLVTGQGRSSRPIFSPDGGRIAYTGQYDGNIDVYVVPTGGGEPRRLTWHPGEDVAVGWSPDGRSILFRSLRASPRDLAQFYLVPADGGPPTAVPLPSGEDASFSPDGSHLAYTPFSQWQPAWKHYRGGQTARIWIANLADSSIEKLPRENSNDRDPMWGGDTLYFLSDRDGPVTLYAYDTRAKAVRRLIENDHGFDIASASAGPGGIVYDQFGSLKLYDSASGAVRTIPVTIAADLPQVRARFVELKPDQIQHAAISATGKRVLVETRGEILSVPAEKGDIRNLTQSPGVADRDPASSPDGRQVAYFSDESGEYALHIRASDGQGAVHKFALGDPPSFYYSPRWSPDGKKIVFFDKRLNLWLADLVKGGKPVRIDSDLYDTPFYRFDPAWSPDSRWIAYTRQLPNHLHAAFVYATDTGAVSQITDGLSDAASPRFDASGKYLYFTASTSIGLGAGWLDMSSLGRPVDGAVYLVVLRNDIPSPILPESDEETPDEAKPGPKTAGIAFDAHASTLARKNAGSAASDEDGDKSKDSKKKDAKASAPKPVRIDFDHIDQRIVALPIPRANFAALETGPEGIVYTLTAPAARTDDDILEADNGPPDTLWRFDTKSRKNVQLADGVTDGSFAVSADRSKILFAKQDQWIVADGDAPPKAGEGALKLDEMSVWVDPRAEWKQMYREAWRIERDFLYDPHTHGLDIQKASRLYAPYVDGLAARQDLNTLLEEMTGHIAVGHTFVRGGALPDQQDVGVGLLGADYALSSGHWKIARILRGENWNPKLVAPLSQPGVNVHEGEYLLAVNGKDVSGDSEVYRAFEGLAGKQTTITVGPNANGAASRQVVVVPVGSETALRLRSWMEANRREVDTLSGGKLAYVYIPDTGEGGFANFNRYYYAQVGRQGVILDERFNHGGDIADYIVDQLNRTPKLVNASREGADMVEPAQTIFGPKVMIINQGSGSGGDAMPWLFRQAHAGTLVGTRTWGGLVGIGDYPALIDGGIITAPRWALYSSAGQFDIENIGVPPDVEVEQDPALVRQGHDPQLEEAVRVALDQLARNPLPTFPHPPYPDKHPVLPDAAGTEQ